jgi:hypothetical protein
MVSHEAICLFGQYHIRDDEERSGEGEQIPKYSPSSMHREGEKAIGCVQVVDFLHKFEQF